MPEVSQLNPTLMSRILERLQGSISSETTLRPDQENLGVWNRGRDHQPFVLTCDSFARAGRYIVFWANPSNWEWTMNQRGMVQKTHGGTVVHMWRSRHRPTYYDEIALTVQFQSGNVMPIRLDSNTTFGPTRGATAGSFAGQIGQAVGAGASAQPRIVVPPGLMNFYEYIELKDEPKILDTGAANYVSIIACSPMFPQIVLQGYINPEGFSFSENADDLGGVTWNDSFTIVHTYPEMRASNLQAVFQSFSGQDAVTNLLRDAQGQTALLNLAAGGIDVSSLSGGFPTSGFASGGTPQNAADNFSGVPPQAGDAATDPQQNIATGAGSNTTGTRQPVAPSREITNPAATTSREARLASTPAGTPEATNLLQQQAQANRQAEQNAGTRATQQNLGNGVSMGEVTFTRSTNLGNGVSMGEVTVTPSAGPTDLGGGVTMEGFTWNPSTGTVSPTPAQLQEQLRTLQSQPPSADRDAQISAVSAELNAINAVNNANGRRG
jgi:hypothetical protein